MSWVLIACGMVLAMVLAAPPDGTQAASGADLGVLYDGYVPGSAQDVKFTILNSGIASSPATTVTISTTKPAPSNPVTITIPPIGQNKSIDLTYHLPAACNGTIVHVSINFPDSFEPNNNNFDANICSPDLKIDVVGLAPGSFSDVQVAVTNVGPVNVGGATATVQTVQPGPANPQSFSMPPLGPGEVFPFVYTLDAPCSGHTVQATVDVQGDVNPGNNTTTSNPLCQVRPTPVVPDYLQPGIHTLDLNPTVANSAGYEEHYDSFPYHLCPTLDRGPLRADPVELPVGWGQYPCGGASVDTVVQQTAVRYDLGQIDAIPNRLRTHP